MMLLVTDSNTWYVWATNVFYIGGIWEGKVKVKGVNKTQLRENGRGFEFLLNIKMNIINI